uniref:RNase H domain-containing protein n=1 Tax=Strongyloides venezuelensis TaxID=75913 RepID=A0A0K0FST5_STRVS
MNLFDLLKTISTMDLLSDPDAAAYQIFLLDRKFFKGWTNDKLTKENATRAILQKLAKSLRYAFVNLEIATKNMITSTPISTPINSVRKEKNLIEQISELSEITPIRLTTQGTNVSIEIAIKKDGINSGNEYLTNANNTNSTARSRSQSENEITINTTGSSMNCISTSGCRIHLEFVENQEELTNLKKIVNEIGVEVFARNNIFGYIFVIKNNETKEKTGIKRRMTANYTGTYCYVACLYSIMKIAFENKINAMRIFTDDNSVVSLFKDLTENSEDFIKGATTQTKEIFIKIKKIAMGMFQEITITYIKNGNVNSLLNHTKKAALSFK